MIYHWSHCHPEEGRICTDIGDSDYTLGPLASLRGHQHPGDPSFLRMTRRRVPDETRPVNNRAKEEPHPFTDAALFDWFLLPTLESWIQNVPQGITK